MSVIVFCCAWTVEAKQTDSIMTNTPRKHVNQTDRFINPPLLFFCEAIFDVEKH